MKNEILSTIHTDGAPAAVAAYSQGTLIKKGRYREVVTSGQIAFDPQSGKLVEGGIIPQTERVLENVGAILKAGGANPGDIVETTVLLTDHYNFGDFNNVYKAWSWIPEEGKGVKPARFTSGGLIVIPGALVEVQARAVYKVSRRAAIIDLFNPQSHK